MTTPVQLTVGAGHNDRIIHEAGRLLQCYREDTGCHYLDYVPTTPIDKIVPEDLAVTLLVNSQVGGRAFRSVQKYGNSIDLTSLPQKPLEETSVEEQRHVAHMIATVAQWPGFAASVATKVLHKKRPELIPILDNQAIFGAYLNRHWPAQKAPGDSVRSEDWIFRGLNWIAFDITRPENDGTWELLQAIEPGRTRIQLFDSVWWMYFRALQPLPKRKGKENIDDQSGSHHENPRYRT